MRINILIIIILLLLKLNIHSTAQSKINWDIRFPLDIKATVSGSFGELRSNHFHAGIDFTTNQTTGLPVYAIDEGFVSRIFVSPSGYGKAVYIDHPNGYTTVYGHLDSFAPKIETIITNLQYEKQSFSIDHYFEPEDIILKKGEIIGYSGNSGSSGGPHLHFELRETDSEKPVNAHLLNLSIKDDVPPHIEAICVYPLDDDGSVNGKNEALYLPAVFSEGKFRLKGNPTVTASGNIGIGVETLDYYTGSWRKCGVNTILLKVNNSEVFKSKLDIFSYDNQRYINSHIDYAMLKQKGKSIQKSFVDINNQLDIYTTNLQRGTVNVAAGNEYNFDYTITDPSGNSSSLEFKIKGVAKQPAGATFRPAKINAANPFETEIDGFKVKFPANSFYTDVPFMFSVEPNEGKGLGNYFHVFDEIIPVHNSFEVTVPIPEDLKKIKGLCAGYISKGKLSYAGGRIIGSNMIVSARNAGIYTLAADSVPPTIRLLNVPQGRNYSNQKNIRIEIKDNFSGISDFKCIIDDNWELFEYDQKNNVLIGYFNKFRNKKGIKHQLEITVTDGVGNIQNFSTNFVY